MSTDIADEHRLFEYVICENLCHLWMKNGDASGLHHQE